MTAFTPPAAQQEIDFLEEVERELVALTTAELEGVTGAEIAQALPFTITSKTVIRSNDGTHADGDVTTKNEADATPSTSGPRLSPG